MLSGKGKNASEANIDFSVNNSLALDSARLTLLILLGWPDPIPKIDFPSAITIALDLTNFIAFQAKRRLSYESISGFDFVTKFQSLTFSIWLSFSWNKTPPLIVLYSYFSF